MRIIGIMSGTSFDAIDVAAADITLDDDTLRLKPLGAVEIPHGDSARGDIMDLLPPARTSIADVCRLDNVLGQAFARAAEQGVYQLADGVADLVVCHGQTVYHWNDDGQVRGSLQLGRPSWIAAQLGLPVISDLRNADIANGGQGAPLVPIFDALLLRSADTVRAALNLGGIANLTVTRPGAAVIGYDVGPANALIDVACAQLLSRACDLDGRVAAKGRIVPALLESLLAEPFYEMEPPKSTGKELFNWSYLQSHLARLDTSVAPEDVVATVTELTAEVVAAEAARHQIAELVAAGGGTANPVLMRRLRQLLPENSKLSHMDEYGISTSAKEAYAFAVLGYLSWHGVSGALTSVTGARTEAILGSFTPGNAPLRLPEPARQAPARLEIVH